MKAFRLILVVMALSSGLLLSACRTSAAPVIGAGELSLVDVHVMVQRLLDSYSTGDEHTVQDMLSPRLVGFGKLMTAVRAQPGRRLQLRFHLRSAELTRDAFSINLHVEWEARWIQVGTGLAQLREGRSNFVFGRQHDSWRLEGLSGDNPFDFPLP